MAARLIGPISVQSPAKALAATSPGEPITDEDFVYEDDRMVAWFDFSSGGFLRGVWLKEGGALLKTKNAKGEEIVTNLLFGGGYQLLANLSVRPDSPYENFMIFFEKSPRPALPRGQYVREEKDYTEIGFMGQLKNSSILPADGFDPNRDPITADRLESNPYIAQSWPKSVERWVHVDTDPVTRKLKFEKMKGDGASKQVSYRFRLKIYHNKARFDSQVDVFFKNNPPLDVILMVLDTFHTSPVQPCEPVMPLGITGLNTGRVDASQVDNWLGIPPGKIISSTFPPGKLATVRHTEQPGYPGNGATSFVVFKDWMRTPQIELLNGNPRKGGRPILGLDVSIRRDFTDIRDFSHMGFTSTPWFEGSDLKFWWVTNEVALTPPPHKSDHEVRTLRETVSFTTNR